MTILTILICVCFGCESDQIGDQTETLPETIEPSETFVVGSWRLIDFQPRSVADLPIAIISFNSDSTWRSQITHEMDGFGEIETRSNGIFWIVSISSDGKEVIISGETETFSTIVSADLTKEILTKPIPNGEIKLRQPIDGDQKIFIIYDDGSIATYEKM